MCIHEIFVIRLWCSNPKCAIMIRYFLYSIRERGWENRGDLTWLVLLLSHQTLLPELLAVASVTANEHAFESICP